MPTIFELPSELLHYIIRVGSLSQKDVLELALTCKSLHAVVLPILLAQLGIFENPTSADFASLHLYRYKSHATASSLQSFRNPHALQGTPTPDSLSLLKLAFWIKSIPKLRCTIHGAGLPAIIEQVNRLEAALAVFADVHDVEIIFGQADPGVVGWSATVDKDIMVWTNAFCALLKRVVGIGAKRLAVRDGMIMCRVDYIRLPGGPGHTGQHGATVDQENGREIERQQIQPEEKKVGKSKKSRRWSWKMIASLRAYFGQKFGQTKPTTSPAAAAGTHGSASAAAGGNESVVLPASTDKVPTIEKICKPSSAQESDYLGLRRELGLFHERRHPKLMSLVPLYCGRIPRTRLETLEIASEILVLPPFSHWTLDLIKASPHLTRLVLSDLSISLDTSQAWLPRLVDSLSASGCVLTSLSLLNCWSIQSEDLLCFIAGFDALEELIMDKSCDPIDKKVFEIVPHNPVLNRLKKLQATPVFLSYLLRLQTPGLKPLAMATRQASDVPREDPFPGLQELRICFVVSPGFPLDMDDAKLHNILSYATSGTHLKPSIAFLFDDRIGLSPSFQIQDESKEGFTKFACVTDLVVPIEYMGYEMRTRTGRSNHNYMTLPELLLRETPLVTYYAKRLNPRGEDSRDKTFHFIQSLGGVKRVKVVETPILNGGRIKPQLPSRKELRVLVDDLRKECPGVESVEIGGVIY